MTDAVFNITVSKEVIWNAPWIHSGLIWWGIENWTLYISTEKTFQLWKHGHFVNTGQKGYGTQQILDGSPPLIILIDNSGKTTKQSKTYSFQQDAVNFPRIRKHYFEIENRHGDDYDDNAVNMDILHSAQFFNGRYGGGTDIVKVHKHIFFLS